MCVYRVKIKIFMSQKIFIFIFVMIFSFYFEDNCLKISHILLRTYPEEIAWIQWKLKKRRNFTKCAKTFDIDFSSLHLKKLISIVFTVKTLSLIYHHPVCHNCHPFLLISGMRENMQMVVKITNTKQWIVWTILCWPFCNPA